MSRPRIRTEPVETTDSGHLTELLYDDGGDGTLVCALHGGDVEPGTAEAALELAADVGAICWALLGYDDDAGAFETYHPPSSDIRPADYPLLNTIADRGFDTVLSLHGLADDAVIVGGAADPAVKERVRDRLDEAVPLPVETAADGPYGGVSPENPVNWLAADDAGVQVELGPPARADHSETVREALAGLLTADRL